MSKVKIPVTVSDGVIRGAGYRDLPKLEDGADGELVVAERNILSSNDLDSLTQDLYLELLPKGAEVFIPINPYFSEYHIDMLKKETIKISGVPKSKNNVYFKAILGGPLMLAQEGYTRSQLNAIDRCFVPDLNLEFRSLNSAYTALSKKYEVKRSSYGGNVYDNCVFYNADLRKYCLLKDLRDEVLEKARKNENDIEKNIVKYYPFIPVVSVKLFEEKATAGDTACMLKLGIHYLYKIINDEDHCDDKGTNNFVQAIYWFERAIDKEPVNAYYWLGSALDYEAHSYNHGGYRRQGIMNLLTYDEGVKKIYKSVSPDSVVKKYLDGELVWYAYYEYYERAANLGNDLAMTCLAQHYMDKWLNGVEDVETRNDEDLKSAQRWFQETAENNHPMTIAFLKQAFNQLINVMCKDNEGKNNL